MYHNSYESEDSWRSGARDLYVTISTKLANETQNSDGTFSYEINFIENENASKLSEEKNKKGFKINPKNDYIETNDLNLIRMLLGKYNLHEFYIEDSNEKISIEDYIVRIEKNKSYSITYDEQIAKERKFIESSDPVNRSNNRRKLNEKIDEKRRKEEISYSIEPKEESDRECKKGETCFRVSTIDDLNKQMVQDFKEQDYIGYLLGNDINKKYIIDLSLEGKNGTLEEWLKLANLELEVPKTFSEAMESGEIDYNDIIQYIAENNTINAERIPAGVLDKIFIENPDLKKHFILDKLPREISEKYNMLDYSGIQPKDLKLEDLDYVLSIPNNKINPNFIDGFDRNTKYYIDYFKQFDDAESLKKIIARSKEFLIKRYATSNIDVKFVNDIIYRNILNNDEVRDAILASDSRHIFEVLSYNVKFDKESIDRIFEIIKNEKSCEGYTFRENSISNGDSAFKKLIEICKENEVPDYKLVEVLRTINFNIGKLNTNEIKDVKIKGVTIEDIETEVVNKSNFGLIEIIENVNEEDASNMYKRCLENVSSGSMQEKILELYKKNNVASLVSKIGVDEKKKFIDVILKNKDLEIGDVKKINSFGVKLQQEEYQYLFAKIWRESRRSKKLNEELFLDCFEEDSKEEIKGFLDKVYPNPGRDWFKEDNVIKIKNPSKQNRNDIKSLIKQEKSCLNTKPFTLMEGKNEYGQAIKVDNLSKWLFGVPEASGNLMISKDSEFIILPEGTPEETINIIQRSVNPERAKKEDKLKHLINEAKNIENKRDRDRNANEKTH